MNSKQAKEIVNEIFKNIFGVESKKSLEEVMSKFAFDIKLPGKVIDSTTGEETWAEAVNRTKFITNTNMDKYAASHGWMIPKRDVNSLEEVLKIWKKINYTTTERVYNSINVAESDTIYNCENIYRSLDLKETKNSIFCDGVGSSNFMLASQRTSNSNYCIRVDDSSSCSNSYNVICSAKISNSFFIQDCSNIYECIFCSHIANKRFCIANMQFEEEEYYEIKREIIKWILSN